jgi:hypothetical protein
LPGKLVDGDAHLVGGNQLVYLFWGYPVLSSAERRSTRGSVSDPLESTNNLFRVGDPFVETVQAGLDRKVRLLSGPLH